MWRPASSALSSLRRLTARRQQRPLTSLMTHHKTFYTKLTSLREGYLFGGGSIGEFLGGIGLTPIVLSVGNAVWTPVSIHSQVNPLQSRDNYSTTANNMKSVPWPLMAGLSHLVQRWGDWAGWGPAQSPHRCTKCNSAPINGQCTVTVLMYNHGQLFCGFNAAINVKS